MSHSDARPRARQSTAMLLGASLCIAIVLTACRDRGSDPQPPEGTVGIFEVASGLANPLYLTAPANDGRLFIVEQPGRIRIVKNAALLPTPFLDITQRVGDTGSEQGLLGLAFHPNHAQNGLFYVNYTDVAGDTRVERYTVSSNPDIADPASATLILGVDQPFTNHNGGHLLFGPDGMLYIALGDGGSAGDPQENAESLGTLLGKLLRIDVDRGTPYAIPADNPFVGTAGARGEIWAYGLRNPWRIAFDAPAGHLYVADVGQNRFEEVNVVPMTAAGVNYGWDIMEGASCFEPVTGCSQTGLTLPVLVYDHGEGCSVTGGFVYRGTRLPGLAGHYFYSDYCGGWVRSFRFANGQATEQRQWGTPAIGQVLSFGVDAQGEMYVLSSNGRVYRLVWWGAD